MVLDVFCGDIDDTTRVAQLSSGFGKIAAVYENEHLMRLAEIEQRQRQREQEKRAAPYVEIGAEEEQEGKREREIKQEEEEPSLQPQLRWTEPGELQQQPITTVAGGGGGGGAGKRGRRGRQQQDILVGSTTYPTDEEVIQAERRRVVARQRRENELKQREMGITAEAELIPQLRQLRHDVQALYHARNEALEMQIRLGNGGRRLSPDEQNARMQTMERIRALELPEEEVEQQEDEERRSNSKPPLWRSDLWICMTRLHNYAKMNCRFCLYPRIEGRDL
jgi:hypothetical protein